MAYNYSKVYEVETSRHGNGGTLNIRIARSSTAQVVYEVYNHEPIHVDPDSEYGGWIACKYDGCMGFAMAKFIKGTDAYGEYYTYPLYGTVDTYKHSSGGTLNLRASANSGGTVITTIPNGAVIRVQSYSGTWLPAQYNNYTGYVMAKFIRESDAYDATTVSHPQTQVEAFGTRTLGRSSSYVNSGNAVYNVQLCLKTFVEPPLVLDGDFGDRTHEAVRQYQMSMQMTVDGIVGSATKEALWYAFSDELMENGLLAN